MFLYNDYISFHEFKIQILLRNIARRSFIYLIIGQVVPLRVAAQVGAIWRSHEHAARSLVRATLWKPEVCALAFEMGATLCGAVELAPGWGFFQNADGVPQCTKNEVNTSFTSSVLIFKNK